jgi:hypothetical protein
MYEKFKTHKMKLAVKNHSKTCLKCLGIIKTMTLLPRPRCLLTFREKINFRCERFRSWMATVAFFRLRYHFDTQANSTRARQGGKICNGI